VPGLPPLEECTPLSGVFLKGCVLYILQTQFNTRLFQCWSFWRKSCQQAYVLLPKVPFSTIHQVILKAFCPSVFILPEQEKHHLLCPDSALLYVHHTTQWHKAKQLFICHGSLNWGAPIQTMSHWVRDTLSVYFYLYTLELRETNLR